MKLDRYYAREWAARRKGLASMVGVGLALLAAAIVVRWRYQDTLPLAAAIIALIGAGYVVSGLIGFFTDVWYRVETSDFGIRRSDRSEWVPWSSIVRVRERAHHLDLYGDSGYTGVSLDVHVKDFDAMFATVLERARFPSYGRNTLFDAGAWGRQQLLCFVLDAIFAAMGVWLFLDRNIFGAAFAAVVIVMVEHERRAAIRSAEIVDNTLVIKTGNKKRTIHLDEIEGVRIRVRGRGYGNRLEVEVHLGRRWIKVRPEDVDGVDVYLSVRNAVERQKHARQDAARG